MKLLGNGLLLLLIWSVGTSVFSFVNVLIYRIPRAQSFVRGYSFCPECRHRLQAVDLIPVFGRVLLNGKCRYCGGPIPVRDTWIEVLGGCIALLCIYKTGYTAAAVTEFVFLATLTAVAFIDVDTMEIPDGLVLMIAVTGLMSLVIIPDKNVAERLIGFFSASVPLLVITLAVPGAFGGGDIKLMAASGILLGWRMSLLALFLAILTGGVYGIYLLAANKKGRKDHFAFGPFLCLGMLAALFWGDEILRWYLSVWGF